MDWLVVVFSTHAKFIQFSPTPDSSTFGCIIIKPSWSKGNLNVNWELMHWMEAELIID